MTRTVPVEKYLIPLHGTGQVDVPMAREGWCSIVRAQGWTPVGEPEVVLDDAHGQRAVVGRLIRADLPGVTINGDITNSVVLP